MERYGYTMTEDEWLMSDNHMLMTFFVGEQMSLRKLRLADVAVCRRVEGHLVDERSRHALEVSERYADGLASDAALNDARSQANAAYQTLLPDETERRSELLAALSVVCAAGDEWAMRMEVDMIDIVLFAPRPPQESIPPEARAASITDAELARDVFGNPFRPVAFDPNWRTETVVSLASAIYADRAFDRMPILADALEEVGCDNTDILSHCRGPGPHARGCWVVDGVLGKQ